MNYILKMSFLACLSVIFLYSPTISAQNELILNLEDITANANGTVELDITTEDFEQVAVMQFAIYWDSTILDYNSVTNFNNDIPTLNETLFNEVQGGALVLSWQDAGNPRTTADGAVLFTVVFDVVGQECDEGNLTISDPPDPNLNLEIIKNIGGSFMEVDAIVNDGSIMINGENCGMGGTVLFRASDETVAQGEEVCVQIEVENFENVVTIDFALQYDQTVLEFIEPRSFNLPSLSSANFNDTGGSIRFSWNASSPVTRPDGTVIFELCFNAIGNQGEVSAISFVNDPIPIEVVKEVNGNPVIETPDTDNGSVTIDGGMFNGLEVVLGDQTASAGSSFCVPVIVNGFDAITTFSFQIEFDETRIRFDSLSSFNLDFLNSSNFNTTTADNGVITLVWFDNSPTLEGVTVPDGTVIFEYCFTVVGDCEATSIDVNPEFSGYEAEDVDGSIPIIVRSSNIECGFSVDCEQVSTESCADACDGELQLTINGGTPQFEIIWSGPKTIPMNQQNPTELCAGTYNFTVTDANNFSVESSCIVESPNAFRISGADISPEINGNDGAIDIDVTGKTNSLEFNWDTDPPSNTEDISGLSADIYNLTITDTETGCQIDTFFEVQLQFTISVNKTDIECNGDDDGSISITTNGGSGSFSYDWSCSNETDANVGNLPGGDCTVTVTDDNTGFQVVRTISINEPSPIVIDTMITMDDGTGSGAIDITPSGGSGGYSYEWSNGATSQDLNNLEVGIYCLTITDSRGCAAEFCPLVVTDGSLLIYTNTSLDVFNGFGVSCQDACDGFIEVQVFGGEEPYTINWGDGSDELVREDLCPGTYAFTIEDGEGSTFSEEISLTEPAELSANVITNCSNDMDGAATVSVEGGASPYLISFDGIAFDTVNTASNLAIGSYTVFVRDANGCERMVSYNIRSCTSGDCYEGRPAITPNGDGLNDQLVIRCATDRNNTLQIFDRFGRLVFEQDNYANDWEGVNVNGDNVNEGTYLWIFEVELNDGSTRIYKGTVAVLRNLR